ncbi:MAG TPA: hypothetical protein VHG92_00815 [Afifellaceae bacterium]|nr:hypothetical protein [Afifellaceae bacterium]
MRIMTGVKLLALVSTLALQACFGIGSGSPEQPLPLLGLSPDSPAQASASQMTPEEARAQAVAEIRAKASAHQAQNEDTPYPPVFAAHGPPLAIAAENKSETQIQRELARVRTQLQKASEPEEVAELEERMAELLELGRNHERDSEEQIRAISEANQ